ncbi:MAG: DNA alkylation repair protein [Candidatus Margulisbacteria bacterium]|nr:DNA alkylation repair protein [Candidatus Margulisiibacteriota bacterium]
MKYTEIIKKLKSKSNPQNIEGMARFGINPKNNLGLSVTTIRKIAKGMEKDHELARRLWASGIRDARMLACLIEKIPLVTEKQADHWVKDFDSWDLCDHACGNLFDRTKFAYKKVGQWGKSKKEFIKRAGFALLAWLAVHDKQAEDKKFLKFLPLIRKASTDERNYVKKAVNWALRCIGKRNLKLNLAALKAAREIQKINSKAARWNAGDTLRELTSKQVLKRLRKK